MDGQTDKQTENLPILQDFVPYLSVCLSVCLFVCLSLCLSVFLWIESWEGLSPKLVQDSPELGQIEPQIGPYWARWNPELDQIKPLGQIEL